MASDRQIAANRRNALMSTGPRSLAGRTRSSQNAVTHGLTARHAMLPGEDPEEFSGLRHAMFSSLLPQGALENQLVERAVSLIWRMRRIQVFEMALFEWTAHLQKEVHDGVDDPILVEVERRNDNSEDDEGCTGDLQDRLKLGRMLEALLSADLTTKLSRYETGLQRHLSMTLKELRELKVIRADLSQRPADDDDEIEHGPRGPGLLGPP